jgi:hypothetical protein
MKAIHYAEVGVAIRREFHEAKSLESLSSNEILKYLGPLEFKSLKALLIDNCILRGRDLVAFQSFYPTNDLWPHYRGDNKARKLRQVLGLCTHRTKSIKITNGILCSLASHPSWELNFFHWFIDIIPRIFAAESVSNGCQVVRLIKPGEFETWQRDSLNFLGYNNDSLITISNTERQSIRSTSFVGLVNHRKADSNCLPPFSIHPYIVSQLKARFQECISEVREDTPRRIIIARESSVGRSFLNMEDIQSFAMAYGFAILNLANFCLKDQIAIFSRASHIIAAHGAGLTNLIHCNGGFLLEVHCSQHGVRGEYYQIAAINRVRYFYHICEPTNDNSDMVVDVNVLESFMTQASD